MLFRLVFPQVLLALAGLTLTLYLTLLLLEAAVFPLVDKELKNTGQRLATEIESLMEEMDTNLRIAVNQYDTLEVFEHGDPKNFLWYAGELLRKQRAASIMAVVDKEGMVLASAHGGLNGDSQNSMRLKKHLEISEFEDLEPEKSRATLTDAARLFEAPKKGVNEVFFVACPIMDDLDSTRLGYLVSIVAIGSLADLLSQVSLVEAERRVSGAIIVDSKTNSVKLDAHLESLSSERLHDMLFGSARYRVHRASIVFPWLDLDWVVINFRAVDVVRAPIDGLMRRVIFVFVISAMLGVILSFLLAHGLLSPIRALTDAVKNTSTAATFKPVSVNTGDEIEFLSVTLEETFSKLALFEKEMTNLVAARTEALELKTGALEKALLSLHAAQDELLQTRKHAALIPLVNGVAHELNTPLGVALTASTSLAEAAKGIEKELGSKGLTKKGLDRFVTLVARTSDLLSDSLQQGASLVKSFKRLSALKGDRSFRHFNGLELKDALESNLARLNLDIPSGIEFDSLEDMTVRAHLEGFTEVLTELVKNSIIHSGLSKEELQISIRIYGSDAGVVVEYSDNGQGVGDDMLSTLFDPFVTTKRGDGLSGLGLTIAYNTITEVFGGTMRIADRDPRSTKEGLRYEIVIPYGDKGA